MSNIITSDICKDLIGALAKAKAHFGPLLKSKANPFFNSKYADLNALLDTVEDKLAEADILITQGAGGEDGKVSVTTRLWHVPTGQYMESTLSLTPNKGTPQDAGSAITYARRYGLQAILCIAAEDDDGNRASGRERRQQQKPRNAGMTPGQSRNYADGQHSDQRDPQPQPASPSTGPLADMHAEIKRIMQRPDMYGTGNGEAKLAVVRQFWPSVPQKGSPGAAWAAFQALDVVALQAGLNRWKEDLVKRNKLPPSELDDLPPGMDIRLTPNGGDR